jgi:hypothetical protein
LRGSASGARDLDGRARRSRFVASLLRRPCRTPAEHVGLERGDSSRAARDASPARILPGNGLFRMAVRDRFRRASARRWRGVRASSKIARTEALRRASNAARARLARTRIARVSSCVERMLERNSARAPRGLAQRVESAHPGVSRARDARARRRRAVRSKAVATHARGRRWTSFREKVLQIAGKAEPRRADGGLDAVS